MLPLSICELFVRRCRFFDRLLRDNLVSSAELSWTNSSTKCSHHLVQYLCSICAVFAFVQASSALWLFFHSPFDSAALQQHHQQQQHYDSQTFRKCRKVLFTGIQRSFFVPSSPVFAQPFSNHLCVCVKAHTRALHVNVCVCVFEHLLYWWTMVISVHSFTSAAILDAAMISCSADQMLLWTTEDEPSSSISGDGIIKKKQKSA